MYIKMKVSHTPSSEMIVLLRSLALYLLIIHHPAHITHASDNVLPHCCLYHKPRGHQDLVPKTNQ